MTSQETIIIKKLSELVCRVYTIKGFDIVKVNETPIYQSLLQGDSFKYEEYHKLVRDKYNANDTHTLFKFVDLFKDIRRDGIKNPIKVEIRNYKYEIIDGQHRAVIMWYLHGDIEVEVELI